MRIISKNSNLVKEVSIVYKAVPSKTTMPILECILIDATTDVIKLTANDMELGIETTIDGIIDSRGIIALNAKIFSEIVRKLPDNDVVIETESDNQAIITCEKAKFNIPGQSGEYFSYLPFIEKVSMSYDDSHILKVKVKEKLRTGVFKYMNEYVYFNENGIAMESRNTLFEGVPVVTGVKFNEMNLKRKILENKVPVKKNYFNTIVSITKKITTYKLNVSEIHFEGEDDITLTSSKYKIYLGSSSYLDGKMSKLSFGR